MHSACCYSKPSELWTARCVPHARGAVFAAGNDSLAVGRKRGVVDNACVAFLFNLNRDGL